MDPWCRSDTTIQWMGGIVHRGLLRARTLAEEWLLPDNEDSPSPPDSYVVSFAHFHKRGLMTPAHKFLWGCYTSTRLSCNISVPTGSNTWRSSSRSAKDS
jgi:hypothetical protein